MGRRLPFPKHAMSAVRRASIVAEFGEAPPAVRPSFRMEAGADRAKVYVYDVIGGWDLDALEFVQQLNAISAPVIDLHINSPGGFVYDAVAMYEALMDHDAMVHVHIDGLAASAASFLAMAGSTREIAKAGRVMIHDAQVVAWGSPAQLREAADLGDAISDDISVFYADGAGGDATDWRAAMTAETWYSAGAALEAGLVTAVKERAQQGGEEEDDAVSENRARLVRARARVALGGV